MASRNGEMQEDWQAQTTNAPAGNANSIADAGDNETDFIETGEFDSKTLESDNVGGSSVEIDAEQLLAEVEAEAADGVDASGRIRKRLEAIMERKRRHDDLADFDDYDLDS